MHKLSKKAIRYGLTDGLTDHNYRKASLLKMKYFYFWPYGCRNPPPPENCQMIGPGLRISCAFLYGQSISDNQPNDCTTLV